MKHHVLIILVIGAIVLGGIGLIGQRYLQAQSDLDQVAEEYAVQLDLLRELLTSSAVFPLIWEKWQQWLTAHEKEFGSADILEVRMENPEISRRVLVKDGSIRTSVMTFVREPTRTKPVVNRGQVYTSSETVPILEYRELVCLPNGDWAQIVMVIRRTAKRTSTSPCHVSHYHQSGDEKTDKSQ
jgi:hypothetical protein